MVSTWSAVSQKKVELSYTHTHTHTHTHTRRWEKDTWEMDNRFLMTVGSWQWTLPPQGRVSSEVLLRAWKHVSQWNGRAGPDPRAPTGSGGLRGRLQAFLRSVNWPNVSKIFLPAEELEVWTLGWDAGNSTTSLLHSSLGFLSLLFFLCLWQSHWALGSFLPSHGLD